VFDTLNPLYFLQGLEFYLRELQKEWFRLSEGLLMRSESLTVVVGEVLLAVSVCVARHYVPRCVGAVLRGQGREVVVRLGRLAAFHCQLLL
jgi:hypothetical protein